MFMQVENGEPAFFDVAEDFDPHEDFSKLTKALQKYMLR
jgi:hypothetical protein